MKISHFLALAAMSAGLAGAARAQDRYAFGSTTGVPGATLTFDGVTPFVSVDTGHYQSDGEHGATDQNYVTGQIGTGAASSYRDYFSFAIGALPTASPYASATLSIPNGVTFGVDPAIINFYAVDTNPAILDFSRNAADATGQAIFGDLGDGILFGTATIPAGQAAGTPVVVTLNQAFINYINTNGIQNFAIGGVLVDAVPEPVTWATMLLGLGMVGSTIRYRAKASRVAHA